MAVVAQVKQRRDTGGQGAAQVHTKAVLEKQRKRAAGLAQTSRAERASQIEESRESARWSLLKMHSNVSGIQSSHIAIRPIHPRLYRKLVVGLGT
jgi:hypothetical protein